MVFDPLFSVALTRYSVVFSSPCDWSSRLDDDPWEIPEDERRGWPRGTSDSIPSTIVASISLIWYDSYAIDSSANFMATMFVVAAMDWMGRMMVVVTSSWSMCRCAWRKSNSGNTYLCAPATKGSNTFLSRPMCPTLSWSNTVCTYILC